jgi:hypothetical protein
MIIGLDANIICYALDEEYSEHEKLKDLFSNLSSGNKVALNPTTLHEAYHTLVFGQKWIPEDAQRTLKLLCHILLSCSLIKPKRTAKLRLACLFGTGLGEEMPRSLLTFSQMKFQFFTHMIKNY